MSGKKKPDQKVPHDYSVGYGKPPAHTQFKKGQSGNPRGRPKGTKNLKTDLQEELREMVTVNDRGQMRRVSKQRVAVKTLFANAFQGNPRFMALLLPLLERVDGPAAASPGPDEPLSEQEDEILRAFTDRVRRDAIAEADGEDPDDE